MMRQHWTLTLTVLGRPTESLTRGRARQHRCAAQTRRAMLVVREGDVHAGLRQRLIDSVTRLAGRPVVGVSAVVDKILIDLLNQRIPWPDRSRWTLAEVQDNPFADPYDRRSTTLELVDAPRGNDLSRRRRIPEHNPVPAQLSQHACMS